MPSDPQGTRPTGVLTRLAPDFFDDHMCFGGSFYQTDPVVGNTYATISLYNNATSGILFKVYAVSVGNDDTGTAFAFPVQGTPYGTLVGPCSNIAFNQGAPYGQIFKKIDTVGTPTALYPGPLTTVPAILGAPDAGSATIVSPFPLFIIPVGFSLAVAQADSGGRAWASFWYQMANE